MTQWNARRSFAITLFMMLTPILSMAVAQEAGKPAGLLSIGPHGGAVHADGDLRLEVVFSSQRVQVFVFDSAMRAIPVHQARARLGLSLESDPRKYRYDLYPLPVDEGIRNGLFSAWNLKNVPDRGATAELSLYGLARPVKFSAVFERRRTPEQLAIRRQRICPVSGKPLGSMGKPPSVSIGDREIYVCCAGCTGTLKAKPKFYLAKLPSEPAR